LGKGDCSVFRLGRDDYELVPVLAPMANEVAAMLVNVCLYVIEFKNGPAASACPHLDLPSDEKG